MSKESRRLPRARGHLLDHTMTRRQFMETTVAATGIALASTMWMPGLAHAASPDPLRYQLPG